MDGPIGFAVVTSHGEGLDSNAERSRTENREVVEVKWRTGATPGTRSRQLMIPTFTKLHPNFVCAHGILRSPGEDVEKKTKQTTQPPGCVLQDRLGSKLKGDYWAFILSTRSRRVLRDQGVISKKK
ncbi:Hypothetical protein SMAX5B_008872 [Scophthalmus maximus]|uniref:Uncharacterized protein n=1 Tax=Scophthalmus maximus TaxID=52904 RepID=A0A2U9C7A0_SCOMX|nr:Hypothetical protein SMAX5B_008872 [Scophthalmus maximus]